MFVSIVSGFVVTSLGFTVDPAKDNPPKKAPPELHGSVGDHVLGNERDNAEVPRVLGLKKAYDPNYSSHRLADVSQNELQC